MALTTLTNSLQSSQQPLIEALDELKASRPQPQYDFYTSNGNLIGNSEQITATSIATINSTSGYWATATATFNPDNTITLAPVEESDPFLYEPCKRQIEPLRH